MSVISRNNVFLLYTTFLSACPRWIIRSMIYKNEIVFFVKPEHLGSTMIYLRDHSSSQCEVLIDITCVDYPNEAKRFEVVYNLLSVHTNTRIRVKTCVDEFSPLISISNIFPAANWFEREAYDMFGIYFENHPDLRRILTDYGFSGHPLKKDFPLTGFSEVRYDDSQKRVISEPIELTQDFRFFDFSSPWEFLKDVKKPIIK